MKSKQELLPRRRQLSDEAGTGPSKSAPQFRRNQTLSGYRRTVPDTSVRQQSHSLAHQRRRLGGLFLIVATIVVLLTLLLWQLAAQVRITAATKQPSTNFVSDSYVEVVQEYLTINPAQRLRFTLDQEDLSAFVGARLPEVESLKVSRGSMFGSVNFTVELREPVAGWVMQGEQYYVDKNGIVFQKNYYASPGVQIIDESGVNAGQGTVVAGSRLLGFLGRVVAEAGERGYVVTDAMLPADSTRGLDIMLRDSVTRIKFSIDRGAGEQVEDMDRSLRFLSGRGVQPEYIDVRVSGRAAYR